MDKIKPFIMDKDYDYQNDSLFLYVSHDHEYKESIELGENIILDFDKYELPSEFKEKLNRYKEVLPLNCKKAFDMGARFAKEM